MLLDTLTKIAPKDKIQKLISPEFEDATEGFFYMCNPVHGLREEKGRYKAIGFCFELTAMITTSDSIEDKIKKVFKKEVPENTQIGITLFGSPNIRDYMRQYKKLRDDFKGTGNYEADQLLRKIQDRKLAFIDERTRRPAEDLYDSRIRDIKLTIDVIIDRTMQKGKKAHTKELEKYRNIKSRMFNALQALGMNPRLWSGAQLIDYYSTFFNQVDDPSWHYPPNYNPKEPIREQIPDYSAYIGEEDGCVKVGKRYARVLTAQRMPQHPTLDSANRMYIRPMGGEDGIMQNFIMRSTIAYGNHQKVKTKTEKRRHKTERVASNQQFVKMRPILADLAKSWSILNDNIVRGERSCSISFSVAVFGDTSSEARREGDNAETFLQDIEIEMRQEELVHVPILLSLLPLNGDPRASTVENLGTFHPATTAQVVRCLPICSEWKGLGRPVTPLIGQGGQIMNVDIFGSGTNFNWILAAKSGAGKSVATNGFIEDNLSIGSVVFVIDQGHSYRPLCNQLGGTYMSFGRDFKISLDPFSAIQANMSGDKSDLEDFEDQLEMAVTVIGSMGKLGSDSDSNWVRSSIKNWVQSSVVEKLKNPQTPAASIDSLYQWSNTHDDRRLKDFATHLYQYTENGLYAEWFSQDGEGLNLADQHFVVLELDEIAEKEDLLEVVLLQLMLELSKFVYSSSKRGDHRQKMVIVDEGWKIIAEKHGDNIVNYPVEFIIKAYRQFRKHMASMGLITQSLNDIYANPTTQPIVENANLRFFMQTAADSILKLKKDGKIVSEYLYEAVRSVKTQKPYYSEVVVSTDNEEIGIARLILDRFRYYLYSTDQKDKALIERTMSEFKLNRIEAIELIERKENLDDAA